MAPLRPNKEYKWTLNEPTKAGLYVALKYGTLDPVLVLVVEREHEPCKVGALAYIGLKDNCTYGNPQVRPMGEDFAQWARLADLLIETKQTAQTE